ncbi:uncharacterized protein [Heptranchias perlo]|uniref:uncharacterized protein isoform X2 n=1 Tax=Heptranchias perlo TaxID=212740 RepID=UPI003559F9FC
MNVILKYGKIFLLLFWSCQVNCLFLQKSLASTFLTRIRRANVGLEEIVQNNLERECMEEMCSKEEAREYFRDDQKTEQFWKTYKGPSHEEQEPPSIEEERTSKELIPPEDALSNATPVAVTNAETGTLTGLVSEAATNAEHLPCILNQTLSLRENNLRDILIIGRQILEKQKEVIRFHQDLIKHKQKVIALKSAADRFLSRFRRANSFAEEIKGGNMERECWEETCSKEEVREIFEDDGKTELFWDYYTGRDLCETSPCKNNGTCVNDLGELSCYCPGGFNGIFCQIDIDECELMHPCPPGTTCVDGINKFTCNCPVDGCNAEMMADTSASLHPLSESLKSRISIKHTDELGVNEN